MRTLASKFSILSLIALAVLSAKADAQVGTVFLPASFGPDSAAHTGIVSSFWKFDYPTFETDAAAYPYSYVYKSSYYSLALTAKLGISSVALSFGAEYSTLATFESWSRTVPVKLEAYNAGGQLLETKIGLAVFGSGVTSSVLVDGKDLGASLQTGSLGIEANVKIHAETLNVAAVGYSEYSEFEIPIDPTTGTLKFNEIQAKVNGLFRAYQKAKKFAPILLGYLVDSALYTDPNDKNHTKLRPDLDHIIVTKP